MSKAQAKSKTGKKMRKDEGKESGAAAADELERVELKPRSSRGAVVSVRLTSAEAQALATRAEKATLSLSEFSRRVLRRSLETNWRLMIWDGSGALTLGQPPQTGGDYGGPVGHTEASRGVR